MQKMVDIPVGLHKSVDASLVGHVFGDRKK
jgi:hypothetical protein